MMVLRTKRIFPLVGTEYYPQFCQKQNICTP